MFLTVNEILNSIELIREKDIFIYGAGANGVLTIKTLKNMGKTPIGIGDKISGNQCGGMTAVPIDVFLKMGGLENLCIYTLKHKYPEIMLKLKRAYGYVLDFRIIQWLNYFVPLDCDMELLECQPFNSYQSPYPNCKELEWANRESDVDGMDFSDEKSLSLIKKASIYKEELRNRNVQYRYISENRWFNMADALILHTMIREYRPRRIIEIGSGFSTCVMLDTCDFLGVPMEIECIEPFSRRLYDQLFEDDFNKLTIKEEYVQEVDLDDFQKLEKNDILFIDSSHVCKQGSDVTFELFNILPILASGVIIHFHYIFFPFRYPIEWMKNGVAYNECQVIRAFLTGNLNLRLFF